MSLIKKHKEISQDPEYPFLETYDLNDNLLCDKHWSNKPSVKFLSWLNGQIPLVENDDEQEIRPDIH